MGDVIADNALVTKNRRKGVSVLGGGEYSEESLLLDKVIWTHTRFG